MHKISQIPLFADQWEITDEDYIINSGGLYVDWVRPLADPVHGYSGGLELRNYLFFDGHVKSQKKSYKGKRNP